MSSIIFLFMMILLFFLILLNGINVQKVSNTPVIEFRGEDSVEKILKSIYSGNIESAKTEIQDVLQKYKQNDEIKEYFNVFVDKYDNLDSVFSTEYFIKKAPVIEEYLSKKLLYSKDDALKMAEIVPYYFIKHQEQSKKKTEMLYEQYIDFFTKNGGLTRTTADVICLYHMNYYKNHQWAFKDNDIKRNIESIHNYQNKFRHELDKDSGSYSGQKNYLNSLETFLTETANKRINFIKGNTCPVYIIN